MRLAIKLAEGCGWRLSASQASFNANPGEVEKQRLVISQLPRDGHAYPLGATERRP
jgi:hypothetical protein